MRSISIVVSVLVLTALVSGCVTDEEQRSATFQTYRSVRNLEKDLSPRVSQLSENTADLAARLEANDIEVRKLSSMVEENQVRLDAIQQLLEKLANDMARSQGLTTYGPGTKAAPPANMGAPPTEVIRPGAAGERDDLASDDFTTSTSPMVSTPAVSTSAVAAYNEALKLMDSEDFDTARQQFDAFLTRFPNNDYTHRAQFWKGQCHLKLEQYREAVTEFEKLRTDFPSSDKVPSSMFNQAVAHVKIGETDKAVALLEALVQKYPTAPASDRAKSALRNLSGG
ncbi:MAG: tol-pal system protein YbgF [bacterium]|nr:tol-pal system protein YbgF [bacterium]